MRGCYSKFELKGDGLMTLDNIDKILHQWIFCDIRTFASSIIGAILFFTFLLALIFKNVLENKDKDGKWWEQRQWVIWLLLFGVSIVNYVCAFLKVDFGPSVGFIFAALIVASNIFFRTYHQGRVWLPQEKPMNTPEPD